MWHVKENHIHCQQGKEFDWKLCKQENGEMFNNFSRELKSHVIRALRIAGTFFAERKKANLPIWKCDRKRSVLSEKMWWKF